jgi:hypothetical protein
MTDILLAKKIAKEHGVKGFRKLKLKRPMWYVGQQTVHINKHIALRMVARLEAEGFTIIGRSSIIQSIENDTFDTVTITL